MRDDIHHPLEAKAENALLSNSMYGKVAKAFSKWLVGTPEMARSLARKFTVTADTHPRVWNIYRQALDRMEMEVEYTLFLDFSNAENLDVLDQNKSGALVLTSGSVELLDDRQLLALFGSGLALIKFGMVKHLGMFKALESLPIPRTIVDAVTAPFLDWMQAAYYTSDRAGAYTANSRRAAMDVLCVDMGAGTEYPGLDGAKMSWDYDAETSVDEMSLIGRTLLKHLLGQTDCPWGVDRIRELALYDGVPE